MPLVYNELRRMAGRYMRGERSGHTLQATALVNEAYLRLIEIRRVRWQNRNQFFALAARSMRRILVDSARSRRSQKRGGEPRRLCWTRRWSSPEEPAAALVALDESLEALKALDPRKEQVVELRYFGGLTVVENRRGAEVSPETVMRDWDFAKAWLSREMGGDSLQAGFAP
jgi:RNA polymerase sigma factor (TIGR02999 family)